MSLPLLAAIIVAVTFYPGVLFSLAAGSGLASLRQAVIARAEGRPGPPALQPFYDMAKLFSKQDLVPSLRSSLPWIMLPVGAIGACSVALILLPLPANPLPIVLSPVAGPPFHSDVILVLLLMEVPVLTAIASGALSGSAYAWVSATRRAGLSIASAAPYVIAIMALVVAAGSLDIRQIGMADGWGMLAVKAGVAVVLLLCVPGKTAAPPFSSAEAELEMAGGTTIEYSGLTLLLLRAAGSMQTVTLIAFIFALIAPLEGDSWYSVGAYLAVLAGIGFALSLVEVRTGRMRLRHALRFYWFYVLPLALATLAFALYVSHNT